MRVFSIMIRDRNTTFLQYNVGLSDGDKFTGDELIFYLSHLRTSPPLVTSVESHLSTKSILSMVIE